MIICKLIAKDRIRRKLYTYSHMVALYGGKYTASKDPYHLKITQLYQRGYDRVFNIYYNRFLKNPR